MMIDCALAPTGVRFVNRNPAVPVISLGHHSVWVHSAIRKPLIEPLLAILAAAGQVPKLHQMLEISAAKSCQQPLERIAHAAVARCTIQPGQPQRLDSSQQISGSPSLPPPPS